MRRNSFHAILQSRYLDVICLVFPQAVRYFSQSMPVTRGKERLIVYQGPVSSSSSCVAPASAVVAALYQTVTVERGNQLNLCIICWRGCGWVLGKVCEVALWPTTCNVFSSITHMPWPAFAVCHSTSSRWWPAGRGGGRESHREGWSQARESPSG